MEAVLQIGIVVLVTLGVSYVARLGTESRPRAKPASIHRAPVKPQRKDEVPPKAVPLSDEHKPSAVPSTPVAVAPTVEPQDDLDSMLEAALEDEADADRLLESLLDGDKAGSATAKDEALQPVSTSLEAPPSASAALIAEKPSAPIATELDAIDEALNELDAVDDLLDACLNETDSKLKQPSNPDPPTKPAPTVAAARSPSQSITNPAPATKSPVAGPIAAAAATNAGPLLVPAFMRADPSMRPAPSAPRAAQMMQAGYELLAFDQYQAALEAFCAAHRLTDLSKASDRKAVADSIRTVYIEAGQMPSFARDVADLL